jgi:2-polyprenyl-3-methyl-5-hydroxy-6-metoxy-1,4-benzoquinol methylase
VTRGTRPAEGRDHYSYTVYADPETARSFDRRRFGGPIGDLIAVEQAEVVAGFIGRIQDRLVLDVGTGTGRAALMLARRGARVTGMDASEEMLVHARRRASEQGLVVRFLTGDAHAMDFSDRSFDVVVSLRVLMHAPRWEACLSELCRVADQLVVLDYPSRRSAARIQAVARRVFHAGGAHTEPYRVFSDREIAMALAAHGFRIRSVHRQFVLPIAFHKAVGSRRFTRWVEAWLSRAGLLRLFGSPVTVAAERCATS